MKKILLTASSCLALALVAEIHAQKFLPDDPISRDDDNLSIAKPALLELGPTFEILSNTFGSEATDILLVSENINSLGEVPDSSWFTNRLGTRAMSIEEITRGADETGGPDTSEPLIVLGAGLVAITEGLIVEDGRGDRYYLVFDPAALPNLATGASVIANKFLYAAGYNVFPTTIFPLDPLKLAIAPGATVRLLGGKEVALDQGFVDLFLASKHRSQDGRYRSAAIQLPKAEIVGSFRFHGFRSDDPNDIFLHENRRELRGLRLFAAWLNHYNCHGLNTRDVYVTEAGRSFLKHYLVDFSTALGSGYDLDDRIIPKDLRSGNEYTFWGDTRATLKTALTAGVWERPWMNVQYPYPEFAELGRIEADFFTPEAWRPDFPNAAFDRMLPDDALWAAKILDRFSDEAVRAVVQTARYSDPAAEEYLAQTLIKRRDKIVDHYFRQVNPLDAFRVIDGILEFENLGEARGLASDSLYEFEWSEFDNQRSELTLITDQALTDETRIEIPRSSSEFLMVRIRTRSYLQRGWRKNVDLYLRMRPDIQVVGIDRETGAFTLERNLEGRLVVRSNIEFGGTYKGLVSEQRQFVDDWFRRFNRATGREVTPEEGYNNLPLSTRTTFEAVTNALEESVLTDESGRAFGRALEIVDGIDNVRGKLEGARGDHQFRMFVTLKERTREMLDASREFEREKDNTVFHKGYPLSYRQQGGAPSIQVSMSEDGRRADIDVDYRSSGFPEAILNGHLTAANSDVRAGDNHNRHVNRWEGLMDWWRGILGLPLISDIALQLTPEGPLIPPFPAKGKDRLDKAVGDFLESWLIGPRPELAVSYFSRRAFACLDSAWPGGMVDYGVAPFVMLDRMNEARATVGRPKELAQVAVGVRLTNPRLREIEHERPSQFVLYEVPEDLALRLDCGSRDHLVAEEPGAGSDRYGKYFGAVFSLGRAGGGGERRTVATVWTKEDDYWRIVAYEVDPESREGDVPDTRETVEVTLPTVAGDPAFLEANQTFLRAWKNGDIDSALRFVSPSCYPCVRHYATTGGVSTDEQVRQRLTEGLARVSEGLRKAAELNDVVRGVEFYHPDIRRIAHENEALFSLASLPDEMGEQYSCENLGRAVKGKGAEPPVYGNYFVTAFQLKLVSQDTAVLYLVWKSESNQWKIVAYHVMIP